MARREFFIDKLTAEHDLSSFDCALGIFAWTNQQADAAKIAPPAIVR